MPDGDTPTLTQSAPATPTATPAATAAAAPATPAAPVADAEAKTPTWPADWRQQCAENDEKEIRQLERYASPRDIWKKARALEQRLSSGEFKSALPKDATEDQVKAWRSENGIPDAPEKYDLTFDNGLVVGENDKPFIDGFLKSAHAAHYTPTQVKEAVKWYYDEVERRTEERSEKDRQERQKTEDAMRSEWGDEYRRNINLINGLLDSAPQGLKEKFFGGRLADLTGIGNSPDVLRWLVDLSLKLNPLGTVVPGAGANIGQSVDDEISAIEKTMRENRPAYDRDEKMQSRLRELYAYRERNQVLTKS